VLDAVLARIGRLTRRRGPPSAAVRGAVRVVLPLARAMLGNLRVLAGSRAQRAGGDAWGAGVFRHELSRRVVEAPCRSVCGCRPTLGVLAALLAPPDPDLARVVHHAAAGG
jgi:hypothetical protein